MALRLSPSQWTIAFSSLFFVQLFSFALIFSGTFLAYRWFEKDKIPYLFRDMQSDITSASDQFLQQTKNLLKHKPAQLYTSDEIKLSQWKLDSLPRKNEIFLGRFKEQLYALAMADDSLHFAAYLFKSSVQLPPKMNVTSLQGTSATETSEKDAGQIAFQLFKASQTAEGVSVIEIDGKKIIAGYKFLPGTNLVAVSELSLSDAMYSVRAFLRSLFFGAVWLTLLLSVSLYFLVSKLLRPVEILSNLTRQISSGKFRVGKVKSFNNELTPVFNDVILMGDQLEKREKRLTDINAGTQLVLSLTKDLVTAGSFEEICKKVASCLEEFFNQRKQTSYFLVFVYSEDLNKGTHRLEVENNLNAKQAGLLGYKESNFLEDDTKYSLKYTLYLSNTEFFKEPDNEVYLNLLNQSLRSVVNAFVARRLAEHAKFLEAEMETAKTVQTHLQRSPPTSSMFEIAVHLAPAVSAAGDTYGFYTSPCGRYVMSYVADITGHGVGAAIVVGSVLGAEVALRSELDTHFANGPSVDSCVTSTATSIKELSDAHCASAEDAGQVQIALFLEEAGMVLASGFNRVLRSVATGKYMTLGVVTVDLESGKSCYLSCGHPSPILVTAAGRGGFPFKLGGGLLGYHEEPRCTFTPLVLMRGDILLIASDGLWENGASYGREIKRQKVVEVIENSRKESADAVRNGIVELMNRQWLHKQKEDDVAIVVVKRI